MSGLEWTTRDGRKTKLKDMSLEHLKSTLGILRKKRKIAMDYDWYSSWIRAFMAEIEKRKETPCQS